MSSFTKEILSKLNKINDLSMTQYFQPSRYIELGNQIETIQNELIKSKDLLISGIGITNRARDEEKQGTDKYQHAEKIFNTIIDDVNADEIQKLTAKIWLEYINYFLDYKREEIAKSLLEIEKKLPVDKQGIEPIYAILYRVLALSYLSQKNDVLCSEYLQKAAGLGDYASVCLPFYDPCARTKEVFLQKKKLLEPFLKDNFESAAIMLQDLNITFCEKPRTTQFGQIYHLFGYKIDFAEVDVETFPFDQFDQPNEKKF